MTKGNAPLSQTIDGMSVGILGYGRIGQTIARKLEAFECKISYHARSERTDSPHQYYADPLDMAHEVQALIVITPGEGRNPAFGQSTYIGSTWVQKGVW